MKLNKRIILFVIGGALLTATVVACNHGMHFGTAEERSEWMVQKVSKEMELNSMQRDKLVELRDELLSLRKELRDDRAQLSTDVLAMLQQPTLDREKANTIVSGRLATVNARSPAIIDAVANFYDSLNDTQRDEIREFIQHKIEQRDHRHWHD